MEGLGRVLRQHPFFADLDPTDLDEVVGCATNVRFAAGDYLFREGGAADTFYIVREGRVALDVYAPGRGPLTVDTVESGEIVGLSWLFPPHTWQLDARAVVPVRAVAIDGACLRSKCDTNTRLGYELMQRLSFVVHRRMQSARMRLIDLYGDSRAG
jgi:CRP/FNR family transcriptional regulator, cyclic AMP receptor protein